MTVDTVRIVLIFNKDSDSLWTKSVNISFPQVMAQSPDSEESLNWELIEKRESCK